MTAAVAFSMGTINLQQNLVAWLSSTGNSFNRLIACFAARENSEKPLEFE